MSDFVKARGGYSLGKVILTIDKVDYTINEMFQWLTFEYDINTFTPAGRLMLVDRFDFFNKNSIKGGENLYISYTVSDSKTIEHKLIVNHIQLDQSKSNNTVRYYALDLIESDFLKFMKTYNISLNGTVEEQLLTLTNTYIQPSVLLNSVPTKWNMHFNFNGWRGGKIVEFLVSKSVSDLSGASGARFFKTPFNYQFDFIEDILDENPSVTFIGNTEPDPFTLNFFRYDDFRIEKQGHLHEMLDLGYSSTACYFDPFTKKYISNNTVTNPYRQTANELVDATTTKAFKYTYNKAVDGYDHTHIEDFTQQRHIVNKSFDDFIISIKVPGTTDNLVGSCIELKTLSVYREQNGDRLDESKLNGKYVITKCVHLVDDHFYQRLFLQRLIQP